MRPLIKINSNTTHIKSLLTNIPYKLINNKLFEINELCEGKIVNYENYQANKPQTINIKKSEILLNNLNKIPVTFANKNNVEHFNCKFINNMSIFMLENNNKMKNINYVHKNLDNILDNKNKFKFEIYDYPNFITPMDIYSKGFIILAKNHNKYFEITGFKIPCNTGIYIPSYIPFDKSLLTGDWNYTLV
jgi:hypothetical protein